MPWHFTDEVEAYAERTWDLLAARPAENTIALTVIESVRAGHGRYSKPMLFGWYDTDRVTGAVSMTPPYGLLLAAVPDHAVDELVAALRASAVSVPGVSGDTATADRFAAAWTAGGRLRATTTMRTQLYILGTLRPPVPPPPGRSRLARRGDFETAVDWFRKFQTESGALAVDAELVVRDRLENGLLWLWEDDAGAVVSLAARSRTAAGVARIGPVYTPPEHRRRGYGAAVTAACTRDALEHDADHVVLFTDLANPTSNAIYQEIGYQPVLEQKIVNFEASKEERDLATLGR